MQTIKKFFVLFIRFLKIVLIRSPIYINLIASRFIASHGKFKPYQLSNLRRKIPTIFFNLTALTVLENIQNIWPTGLWPTGLFCVTPVTMKHLKFVKSVRTRSYFGPNFRAFELNTNKYEVSLRIQSECRKMQTRITPNTDTLHAVTSVIKEYEDYNFLAEKIRKFVG